ncbi:hypothetical protein [Novosphingobium sp.]|uniref:hypothetical protein n=1 Tax=Novosphingobium sp. TaxID=1874826 RepID=UPI0027370479|nr:hypothetical protein [Novosphingobium sp.]MDP3908472.1 hypothetical protein [Novosphingobium sp.]
MSFALLLSVLAASVSAPGAIPGAVGRAPVGISATVTVSAEILRFETATPLTGPERQVRKVRPRADSRIIMVEFE